MKAELQLQDQINLIICEFYKNTLSLIIKFDDFALLIGPIIHLMQYVFTSSIS
jgi:hypothetical protein